MTTTFHFREGTTEPITITLRDGNDAANITGYSAISMFLRSQDGLVQSEASSTDSGITVTSASTGVIALDPTLLTTALTFAKERYYGYIIVADGAGDRTSFPSDEEFVFVMRERYSGDG